MNALTNPVLLVAIWGISQANGDEWSEAYLKKLQNISSPPTQAEIEMLATLAANRFEDDDRRQVTDAAWNILRDQDDFPAKLIESVLHAKAAWLKSGNENSYDRKRHQIITSMGNLPDPGTVQKLGEMLDDLEWTRDPVEHLTRGSNWTLTPPNGVLSARSLANLVESPPVQGDPLSYSERDVEVWKIWFEQIKGGNRTFRFKGDPQNFTLNGPASGPREPTVVREPSSEGPGPGQSPSSSPVEDSQRLPVIPLGIACFILVIALWYSTVRRKGS